jgi:hypothetical protein
MDDDLRTLATVLAAPEPSEAAIGRGREQLVEAIGTPAPRRAGWLAGGLGVVAAATAAAVVLSSGSTPAVPRGNPPVTGGASAARQEGQRILLAAAISAAAQPSGTYWHFTVKITMAGASETDQEWVDRDMSYWSAQAACGTTPAGVVAQGPGYGGFALKDGNLLTYQQTEHLPTNPAALAAWFAKYTPPATATDSWIAESLIALEWLVPTPPLVRAAAFRALAALPIITGLGPVPGGQGLLINQPNADGGREELVIDPATALIRSDSTSKATTTIEAANWTNQLPRIVPLCHG